MINLRVLDKNAQVWPWSQRPVNRCQCKAPAIRKKYPLFMKPGQRTATQRQLMRSKSVKNPRKSVCTGGSGCPQRCSERLTLREMIDFVRPQELQ
jgi:hypothetical protein